MATVGSSSLSSISGLISGLKTDDIITQLSQYAQNSIKLLQDKQTGYTTQLTAWQDANTRLLALKIKASSISTPTNFASRSASVSDDTALTASVSADAVPGTYTFTINRLAKAEQRQSQGYGDMDTTTVGAGTLTVGVGANTTRLTIDSTNNTLSGLRDAVNRANVGVSASITDLGSLGAHDYHLVLTGSATGSSNGIVWTPSLSGGRAPSWTTTTAAGDASITVGTGATQATVTKSTNMVSDIYPGMTLNLLAEDAAKTVTVTVGTDTSAVKQGIQGFVDQYNSVMGFLNQQFAFDPATGQTGTLFGDFSLQNIQQQMQTSVLGVIPGLPVGMNTLSQIGFSSDSTGNLVLDGTKLDAALNSDPNGVMKLFSGYGQATDQAVTYVSSTAQTKASGASGGYAVRIDQPAVQSHVTAGAAQTANLVADETVTINGTAVSLTAGMSPQDVLDKINSYSDTTGVVASRTGADGTGTGDYLTLRSRAYGTGGHVTVSSGVSNGGSTPAADTSGIGKTLVTETSAAGETRTGTGAAGRNVAGAFGVTVNGATKWESATGVGQYLTGNVGNASTEGLMVKVTATTAGQHGQVTLTQGVGAAMNNLLGYLTGPSGAVSTAESSLNSQISDLKAQISDQNDRLTQYEDDLRQQFNDLESNMGQLQSQGSYLTAQFAAMNKSTK